MADVSDATNAANLGSAEQLVQINLGLDGTPQSSWTQDQMISYLQGLTAQINSNPSAFNDATISSASNISGTNLNSLALEDPSFDWSQFGSDLEDNASSAGNSLVSIGNGVSSALSSLGQTIASLGNAASNTATLAQLAIPAILVAVVFFAFKTNKASYKGASFSS